MPADSKCDRCGAEALVQGALQSTGTMHFRPFGVPFLTFRTADIAVRATMCKDCGNITFLGDVEKLRAIMQTAAVESTTKVAAHVCP